MSAKDELTALAVRYGVPGLLLRAGLDAVLDEHAHELAEKIRSEAEARVGWGQPMRCAADLIDPEVET